MKTTKYHEGQIIHVTNEYGETLKWTISAINPTGTGERLTLSAPPRFTDGPEQRATVYTNDPQTIIKTKGAQDPARYLKIAAFLRARYTEAGQIATHRAGQPTTYTRRDTLAFQKYILSL